MMNFSSYEKHPLLPGQKTGPLQAFSTGFYNRVAVTLNTGFHGTKVSYTSMRKLMFNDKNTRYEKVIRNNLCSRSYEYR